MTSQEEAIAEIRKQQEEFDEEFGNWEKVEIGQKKTFLFKDIIVGENPKMEKKEGDYGDYLAYTFKVVNLNTKTQKEKEFSCSKKLADAILTGLEQGYNELVVIRKAQTQYQVLPAPKKGQKE